MAKTKKRIDNGLTLLDFLRNLQAREAAPENTEGTLDVRRQVRQAVSAAIKGCTLSRYEIAGRMSHLLGVDVSKTIIDTWTAESKEGHRIPAEYLPAFCQVTGDLGVLRVVAEKAGLFALPGPDALRSEIQRLDEQARKIKREKQKRMLFLKEMETKR